ncbi:DUF6455 family protein [Leisingera daeponensis]|uniref:DUF6455 family protein n=1 Tax=Leisingera daeponensis TaxID=405746 RepID=UPI001C97E83A|nr:DUF6455 family protein [Leisingera daeponensis]MBY6059030.1 hypothetical protein [Leisingera daeponensis]
MNIIGVFSRSIRNLRQAQGRAASISLATAADLSITPYELHEAAAQPADVPGRMQAMARIFRVPEQFARLPRPQVQDMARQCAACPSRSRCSKALARAATAAPQDCSFCPNAVSYQNLAAD